MKSLFVGIDPGNTVGVCIVDSKGEILEYFSVKNPQLSLILERIISYGRPVIIATDKTKIPVYVKKIARILCSKIFSPKKDPSKEEKDELIRKIGVKVSNDHERDSIFAAVSAFKKYMHLIEKIKEQVSSEEEKETVLQLVLLGKVANIKEAINMIKTPTTKQKERIEKIEKHTFRFKFLNKENQLLRNLFIRLRKENEKLKRELKELKNKVKEKSEVKVIRKVVKSEYQKVLSLFPAIFKLIENNKFPIINCDQLEDDEFKMIIKIFDTKLVGFYSNDIKKLEKLSLTSASIFSSIFSFGKIIKIDKNILTSENELLYSLSKEMLKRIKKEWKREKIEKILESYRRGF